MRASGRAAGFGSRPHRLRARRRHRADDLGGELAVGGGDAGDRPLQGDAVEGVGRPATARAAAASSSRRNARSRAKWVAAISGTAPAAGLGDPDDVGGGDQGGQRREAPGRRRGHAEADEFGLARGRAPVTRLAPSTSGRAACTALTPSR